MKRTHARTLLLIALVLLPAAVAAWAAAGPFFLARSVQIEATVQGAGARWALEWRRGNGDVINGRWLDVQAGDEPGAVVLNSPVRNKAFDTLALRWEGAEVRVKDPATATLVERLLWAELRTSLTPVTATVGEGALEDGFWVGEEEGGALVWRMPALTIAQVLDIAAAYVLLLALGLIAWLVVMIGDGRTWYTPQRAALALVVVVHAWLAICAPMLYCPDSMDYAVNAKVLAKTRSFDHFNGWRLPGYSMFLVPFVAGLHKYNLGLGIVQAILGVLTAWLAGRTVGQFLSGAWAALALLVVGLDPVLLAYERMAMPECLTAFLGMLAAWLALRETWWAGPNRLRVCAGAVGLGLLLGAACYVRGNMQLLALALPCAVVAPLFASGAWRRGVVVGGVMLAVAAGCVTPWVMKNAQRHGRAQFVVGSGFTRAQSLVEAGLLDANQSGVFQHDKAAEVVSNLENRTQGWEGFMRELRRTDGTPVAARTSNLESWAQLDARAQEAADESVARNPAARWGHALRATGNLLGVWPADKPGSDENAYWSEPLRRWSEQGLNHRVPPEAYGHLKLTHTRDIYERTLERTEHWIRTDQADAFNRLWTFGEVARPVWAVLMFAGVIGALGRRRWGLLIVGAVVVGHALFLGGVLHTIIDRYQAPLYPIMSVLAVYGLACLAGVAARMGDKPPEGSRTEEVR